MSRRTLSGMVAVVATYVFFLIFVQFGFLRLLVEARGEEAARVPLAAMGFAGFFASLGTAILLRRAPATLLVRLALLGCATSALGTLLVESAAAFTVLAAALGAATGLLTVALAANLRAWLGGPGFGLRVGVATGTAYALCNVPSLFAAPPRLQAVVAAVGCLVAATVVGGRGERSEEQSAGAERRRFDGGVGAVAILAAFLALVWLDSAAFSAIQRSPDLRSLTWDGSRIWFQGAGHLIGAVAAGWWIDRGLLFRLLPGSFGLFVVGFRLLEAGQAMGGFVYAVGIAVYSTALVAYPSFGAEADDARRGVWPRRWRAAMVYGVGGWLGSALGIGMAERLQEIPTAFLVAAAAVMAVSAVAVHREVARRWTSLYAGSLLVGVGLWAAVVATGGLVAQRGGGAEPVGAPPRDMHLAPAVARGRAVYIAEGCIHCHSQYVRPDTEDERLWGPFRPLDREDGVPQLIGNRRNGPDLLNVGNRRSSAWQRWHLIDPARLSPGSRMPSYAHLFAAGDSRGEDLLAYLEHLGRESAEQRYAATQRDPVTSGPARPSVERGRELFARHCAVCHGSDAWGDGPLAERVAERSLSLHRQTFRLVSWGPGIGTLEEGLARVIRFGVPTTSMPGHETMSSRDIGDLVAFVVTLEGTRTPDGSAVVASATGTSR